jgi:hypothetical protein
MRQHTGQQKSDIALDHGEEKHGVKAVQFDQVRQQVKAVHITEQYAVSRKQSQ